MASKKKQKGMVFHQEGATTPAAAPAKDHPPACFVVPKLRKASEGGMDQNSHVTNEKADMMGKPNMYPSKEAMRTSGGLPAVKHPTSSNPQPDNLSPDSICKGIKVTLDNNSMWNEFFRSKTEMILTKQGSRMFPYCRFRISGLQPSRKYSLIMDIQPLDNSRYKWTGNSWQVAGKAECHVRSQPFAHPESPSMGQHWMQNPVSFYKLKLTNSITDQEGNIILHPMHHYLPRLHVVQTDKVAKDIKLNGPSVVTFTFPQTEFMAVTAYQNSRFSQLKVDYNPFVKGLKEDGSSSWGSKLKLNSGKDLHKDGGTATNERHPVKKSLKSLLANHKPKSSKAVDSKPSAPGDLQRDSTTSKDQSAAKVTGECSGSHSRPAQKLFSELIREAHVSLQRCNLEQLGINNGTSHRIEQTNTKTTALKSNRQGVSKKDTVFVKTHSETSPAKKGETVVTKRKVREDKELLNSLNSKDNVRTDSSEVSVFAALPLSQNSSVDHQSKPEASSEGKVNHHKRPAPLPLPALALFLKQHSIKSKKAKSKPDSRLTALPSESLSETQSSHAAPACPPDHTGNATGPLEDLTADITKSDIQDPGCTSAHLHQDEMVFNVTGQAVETAHQPSSPSCADGVATTVPEGPRTDDFLASVSVAESTGPEPAIPTDAPVLPNIDQSFCTFGTSISTISSTLTTSSAPSILSPGLDAVLPAPNSLQTQTITESSTLPSDSPTMMSESLLPDPECSSFGFEPLSPASSPGPLPSLPTSLTLELDSSTSEPTPKAVPPEELLHSEDTAASVFKWHTVLPPPEPYIDTSFTTFQPTPQTHHLVSVTSHLVPSQTHSFPEPQSLDTSTCTPPPDPAPPFQENEQSLPFPAELSPLALQLPLSPTFSSLDADGLSPTPSIADLVHFFSTDDDLGMGVDFSNTEAVAVPCPPLSTVEENAHELSQQVQPIPANKPCKHKKMSRRRKLAKTNIDQKMDDSTYTSMQPNLEEVEEQLFISFTSKEALKLHIVDSSEGSVSQPQTTPEGHLQQTADALENVETAEGLEQKIAEFEKILLRDLKLMRHRQVIHPVLQEVGLKMNLLDPTLAIDLQYLGVHLPIPPPGVSLEPLTQELPQTQAVCAAFVSRTGKTTDVTQIKGWREKFTPSEAPSIPAPPKPEAGPSSDLPKKNLSAFCSDMLDEYLENEGKLIDERAASFSQPLVEPVIYELPTRSTSYVRTLNSVLKKQTGSSPTSDLISGFIPPSKRPKVSRKETKISRRENTKQRGPKHNKSRAEPAAAPGSTPVLSPADSNLVPKQPAVQIPAGPPPSEHTAPVTEPQKSKKHHLKVMLDHTQPSTVSPQPPAFKKRKKLKPKTSSQTLTPSGSMPPLPSISEDMAPLESDSELGVTADQSEEACRKEGGPVMTRALLRQKDLEDGVVWEGRPRTSITEDRAAIALTSLFTLMGFVSENPTAPIQLVRRRAPPCLNEFCRLGCICSSLSHCSRISHCGRPPCMLGCSCLKQKVVLLKNLDGSDSSPSHQGINKKRKRKRRMKMAYILKEADSVSQPAERVRTLWKRDDGASDPDPIHVPEPASLSRSTDRGDDSSSCARVREYKGKKKKKIQTQKQSSKDVKSKGARLKPLKQRDLTFSPLPAGNRVQPAPSNRPSSPPTEPPPKPSKRLIILAECTWASDGDRNRVLKKLCEAMARDGLDEPFWIKKYLISPISQTVEESGADRCIQYKIHISRPKLERENPAAPEKPPRRGQQTGARPQQETGKQVEEEEAEPLEDWQREVEEEEAEPLEDWQRQVEEGDIEEEAGSAVHQVHDGRESNREMRMRSKKKKKKMVSMALPFLTGISPAGFLSANRKQAGGTDHLVQVNGKLYPLAKIQLGKMGALHPANRLAAYLTGRVGSNRKQQGSASSSSPSKHPQNQSSGPTPPTVSSASSVVSGLAATPPPGPQLSVTVLTLPTSPSVLQPAAVKLDQSAASSDQPAGEAPEGAGSRVVTVRVYPGPTAGTSQVRVVPSACSSAPTTDSQVSSCVVPPVNPAPKGSQLLMVQGLGLHGKIPVPGLAPCPPPPSSTSQRMVLQPVQAASGVQYYRRPDGKLVQLVPISQLRPVNPNLSVQRGSSSPSVLPPASHQTPVITVGNQTPPPTTATTSSTSSSPSLLSGLQSFSLPPLPAPLRPTSGPLAQKGTCTFKILPANSSKEPIIVTCAKVPPKPPAKVVTATGTFTLLQPHSHATPMNLISLKPSTGQGVELGVKTVAVATVPVGPDGVLVHQKPASPQTSSSTTIQTPAGTTHRTPPRPLSGSEVKPVLPPYPPAQPALACDPVDLDVICVDDETRLVTSETEGGEKQSSDTAELGGAPSSETENSSDFGDESDSDEETESITNISRHIHNTLEKQRRGRIRWLFEGLRRELGLSDYKTSKVSTLNKAVQVIQGLRAAEADLKQRKMRLTKRRDDYLTTIAPTTVESRQVSRQRSPESELSERRGTGSKDAGLMEVVDLSDETDELTENSSDEERAVTKATNVITVTNVENGVRSVAVETVEESSRLNAAQRKLARIMSHVDSESSLSVKKLASAQIVTTAFKALRSVMNAKNCPKRLLLKEAHQEIQILQRETERLKSLKICLNQRRDAYIREISQRSGKSEQSILRKLQHLLSKQRKMEKQERLRAANQLPAAAGGGVCDPPAGDMTDDIIITSTDLRQQTPRAPLTPLHAPPPTTPVQTPAQQPQRVLQVPKPPGVSHNASVVRDRPRTVPNILSRRKNPAVPLTLLTNTVEESRSFQALVPAEVLSLVGAAFPGQPVLALSPLVAGQTVLQASPTPGVASVTLNFPSMTNQQIHLTSMPRPSTGKIYSSSAPFTITNLAAANVNNLLQLVQPSTTLTTQTQQQQTQQQQTQQQTQQPPPQQQVPAGQPPPPLLVVSAGSDFSSDQIKDQDQPPSQTDPTPSSPVTEGGPQQAEAESESLTSLLNEIVFLNQQTVTTATTAGAALPGKPSSEVGQQDEEHAHSPCLLHLDSDSDDTITTETMEAGLNDHSEMMQSGSQPRPAKGNSKGGVLAPPPLLQMKVGGVKVADPASSDDAAGGGGRGRGGRREGSVLWRPMPRLVPLGLRGNPPS